VPDLTPQLRTRLSRVERAVGVFVLLATLLLAGGFAWYVRQTALRKGWFLTKARYYTLLDSATGLKVGDPVMLMGFTVGEITRITGQPPEDFYNVYVEFTVREPYFGYLWTGGSKVRVSPADFLGKRTLEVTKGTNYLPTHLVWPIRTYALREAAALATNPAVAARRDQLLVDHVRDPASLTNPAAPRWLTLRPLDEEVIAALAAEGRETVRVADRSQTAEGFTAVWDLRRDEYVPYTAATPPYFLPPDEAPALSDRLVAIIQQTESALTNQVAATLEHLANLTSNANRAVVEATPLLSNLAVISGQLRDPDGSLGRWVLPPELHAQLRAASTNANTLLADARGALTNTSRVLTNASVVLSAAQTNLGELVAALQPPLAQLTAIVSNLNTQVSANTNFVTTLHTLLVDLDDLIQGFKRHWLLRGAFKTKPSPGPAPTNAPPRRLTSPRGAELFR
jgi:ABC-type transporter Mla subunit MlaD